MLKQVFCIFIFLITSAHAVYPDTLYVGEGQTYKSIKTALSAALDGDIIIIQSGIYKEGNIKVDKRVSLRGAGMPVLDGEDNNEVLTITADGVEITGIKVINTGITFMKDVAAIKVENSKYVTVRKNVFENDFFAIYLSNSQYCTVDSNLISGNAVSESFSGNGVHLWKCNNITVTDNIISGQRDGIYFEFAKNSTITGNYSHNNLRYGLHFMFSEGNTYKKNIFSCNGAGVAVMYTKNVTMTQNRFETNWGSNSYGLLLKDIDHSIIEKNIFSGNTTGIYMESSSGTKILNNNFLSNGWAFKILGNCYEDTIELNNFLNNTFDISTNSSQNLNKFNSNYWDRYDGYDLDRDGTGDIPYHPVSLFSTIVEQSPESILLLRSFLVNLLDLTERYIPVFTPQLLVDGNPRMKEVNND